MIWHSEGEGDLLEEEFERTVNATFPRLIIFLKRDNEFRVNIVGVIHSTNSLLPLLPKGNTKKVIAISSTAGTEDFVLDMNLESMPAYGASKTTVNMIIAKFSITLKKEGIVVIVWGPGLVNTSQTMAGTWGRFFTE